MKPKLQTDRWLFVATVGLALFGVVMVYSSSAMIALRENGNQFQYVMKQAMWTGIGLVALVVMMQIDYQRLRDWRIVAGLLLVTVLLLGVVFGFPAINGARRWIRFAGFSIQPSEVAKPVLVIFLAFFLEKRAGDEWDFWRTFIPCMAVSAVLVVLVAAEPDLGTAAMLALICLVVCYTAGIRVKHIALAAAAALGGFAALLLFVPFRVARLIAYLDPWADPLRSGFQIVQSLMAVGSGGVHGLGFAQGKQKMLFLPFAHSDFIFAVVGEELGLVGSLIVLGVFGLIFWRGMRAALRAPDRFGKLLGLGLVTGIVAQALFNMSVVTGLLPPKGIPLPLISYGGSSLVPTLASIGILLNISQYAAVESRLISSRGGERAARKEERQRERAAMSRGYARARQG